MALTILHRHQSGCCPVTFSCLRKHHSQDQYIFLSGSIWFMFSCGEEKWLCIYAHYFPNSVIISLYWCSWAQTYLTYWRVAGADVNRSTSFPCFSRLAISLSSVARAVNRHLQFLPMATVWLGCASFRGLAWDFQDSTITHTVKCHMHGW
jgi:hypothetical protein